MAFFTGQELIDIVLMSLATGFIFMDMFRKPATSEDPVQNYLQQSSFKERFFYAIALVAPAIILHELGHKFVAMGFGLQATFNAAYTWLGAGILLKLLRFPFLIIVPAYVSTIGASAGQTIWIAAAGPIVNGILYIVATIMYKKATTLPQAQFWGATRYINGFLCIFNFLPIPGFDGYKVFANLIGMF